MEVRRNIQLTEVILGGVIGALGIVAVVVGAVSAHGHLSYVAVNWIDIGLRYHLPHVVAAWGTLWLSMQVPPALRMILLGVSAAWTVGVVGFSCGLYVQAFWGVRMGGIIPSGAVLLMLGWGMSAWAVWKWRNNQT